MSFNNEFDLGDIISIVTLLIAIAGGIFGLFQWRLSVKTKRAEYINELTMNIRTDKVLRKIIYMLDYDDQWYNEDFHKSKELEKEIDKTLSYFTYICYLKQHRLLTRKEFVFFKYEIDRILMNSQIQNYFYNLYHFYEKFDIPFSFKSLFDYGVRKHYFPKEFFNRTSMQYPHYLNF